MQLAVAFAVGGYAGPDTGPLPAASSRRRPAGGVLEDGVSEAGSDSDGGGGGDGPDAGLGALGDRILQARERMGVGERGREEREQSERE